MLGARRGRLHGLRRARRRAGHRLAVDRHPRRGAHRRARSARCTALVSVTFRVDQIISGVVINLLALGAHQLPAVAGDRAARTSRPVSATSAISIPLLSDIPVDRRAALHEQADLLRDVRDRGAHLVRAVQDAVGPAGPVVRREPARGRDARHQRDQDPLPGGDPRRADRRARRGVVLDGEPGRLPGQHDERRRLHRPGRADLRALAPVERVRRGDAVRLHPGARHPPADPRRDDRRLLDPERVLAVAARTS